MYKPNAKISENVGKLKKFWQNSEKYCVNKNMTPLGNLIEKKKKNLSQAATEHL